MKEGDCVDEMIVADNEVLHRAFSAPSCVDDNWRPMPHMFLLNDKKGEEDVSLSRLLYETLSDFTQRSLRFPWKWMSKIDKPGGVASLIASEIRSLDNHIELVGPTNSTRKYHAGILFRLSSGEIYHPVRNTTNPEDANILGYRTLLANAVRIVYNNHQEIKWEKEDCPSSIQ